MTRDHADFLPQFLDVLECRRRTFAIVWFEGDRARSPACYSRLIPHDARARRPATCDDLLKVPDQLVAEIVNGELHITPRPAPRYTDARSGLGGPLHGPFDRGRGGPGGWRILDEPEVHVGPDIVVPDLAGWRARTPTRAA